MHLYHGRLLAEKSVLRPDRRGARGGFACISEIKEAPVFAVRKYMPLSTWEATLSSPRKHAEHCFDPIGDGGIALSVTAESTDVQRFSRRHFKETVLTRHFEFGLLYMYIFIYALTEFI